MIKEIVDIGRVSNRLGSVFTFKGLPEFYVELILDWNKKYSNYMVDDIKIKHLSEDINYSTLRDELYLNYGVHRGKKSNIIYIFPSSFIFENKKQVEEQILNFLTTETKYSEILKKLKLEYEKEKNNYKKLSPKQVKLLIYPKIIELIKNNRIKLYPKTTRYYKAILENLDEIEKFANITTTKIKSFLKGKLKNDKINKLSKQIPIIIKLKKENRELFFYQNKLLLKVFENIEFKNTANLIKQRNSVRCNIYENEQAVVYPSGGFYYAFSIDKVNVKYSLKDDKNLFILSKQAYIDFMVGRTFLETFNSFYFMRLNCYITATSLNDNSLKEFQKDAKDAKSNLEGLINLIDKHLTNRFDTLLNFYFFEPTKTGNNIVEYIKDIIPSKLVQTIKLSDSLREFYQEKFDREKFQYNWQQHIYNIYYKDSHKKYRTSLFRQIALGDEIDLDRLLLVINNNMQYSISKPDDSKDKYYYGTVIKHFMFLDWLDKINKGVVKMSRDEKKQEFFEGKTYEERLGYFLDNANLVKETSSMKLGVCVGLSLNILSWSINGYDKKTLAFVGKRIERNSLNSVQSFVNEIFAKTKFHEYEGLQSVNIRLATNQMLHLDNSSFNKDEFIFGLFLGSELYQNVKSEKDPEIPTEIQNNGDNNNENN